MTSESLTKYFNQEAVIVTPSVLFDRAILIFDMLADMEDIAFGYAADGCYARAHLMCCKLIEQNLMPKKAWAFEGEKNLTVKAPSGTLKWWYHVAPVLSIEMPDKTVQDMVLDPALFDGPVSLQEWGKIMNAPPDKVQIVPFGVAPIGHGGDYDLENKTLPETDRQAEYMMKKYLGLQKKEPRKVFPSQSRQQSLQAQGGQAQGKTWVTFVESSQLSQTSQTSQTSRFLPPQQSPAPQHNWWQKIKSMVAS